MSCGFVLTHQEVMKPKTCSQGVEGMPQLFLALMMLTTETQALKTIRSLNQIQTCLESASFLPNVL